MCKKSKGRGIRAESTIKQYIRHLSTLYRKYTAQHLDPLLKEYIYQHINLEVTHKFALRREPKPKPSLGPDAFTYLAYFLWVRDLSSFDLGLD